MLSEHRRLMDAVTMAVVLLGSGFIGFLFAPLGLGGGLLFAPLLHYGLGWDIDGALLIVSLGLSATVSWGSGLRHRKEGHVSDVRFKQSLVGALPGAIIGVVIVASLSGSFDVFFKTLSLGFVTWAIIKTLRSKKNQTRTKQRTKHATTSSWSGFRRPPVFRLSHWSWCNLRSCFAYIWRFRITQAIGTSLHIMMVVLPISILTHFVALDQSQVDVLASNLWLILSLPIVVIVAANLGARFGIAKVSEQRIMQLFVAVLFVIGIRYVLDLSSKFL